MKTKFSDPPRLFLLCLCLFTSSLWAQITPTPSNSGTSGFNFQVIESQAFDIDGQVTIFNRVVPPVFPAQIRPSPTPTPVLSPVYLQWLQAESLKANKLLFISATIYDHNVTDVRLSDGTGSCRVFSNINFAYLSGLGEFETPDTIYEYFQGWGDDTTDSLRQNLSAWPAEIRPNQVTLRWVTLARQQLPNLAISPSSQSGYLVAEPPPSGSDMLKTLDAIHAYYDANHVRLIAISQQQVASEAAAQAWAAAHPPTPPPPITINFWPVKNSRYLTTGTKGINH